MSTQTPSRYSPLQIGLHWLIALLIAAAFFTHEEMGRALRERIEQNLSGMEGATVHTVVGVLALLLILVRVAIRLKRGAPEPKGSPAVRTAAHWGHRLIYLLMIATPIFGIVAWQGKLRDVGDIHGFLGQTLIILALGHAAMAIWHEAVKKDGTMRRMVRPSSE